jgi:ribosome-associated toxin RatA of RatAB toxin-antitoxin module
MKMRNEILVNASPQRIYDRAAATERWPEILPHYRFVRVLSGNANSQTIEMAAWATPFENLRVLRYLRMTIPVRWRAEQTNDPRTPAIAFRHLGGWTKGMQVLWRFESNGVQTRVTIDHELRSPLAGFIGKYFIDPVATRTLRRMKTLAENDV